VSHSPTEETMGDSFADGTRPTTPTLTADQIQALRMQERAEKARHAALSPRWRDLPEMLD
jgi:hypothetical protein